uniref:Uncharacterized protein n=1 Tax=Cucumis sativus TaxID=3659 RepID=A0A0A0KVX9_CUCSA
MSSIPHSALTQVVDSPPPLGSSARLLREVPPTVKASLSDASLQRSFLQNHLTHIKTLLHPPSSCPLSATALSLSKSPAISYLCCQWRYTPISDPDARGYFDFLIKNFQIKRKNN